MNIRALLILLVFSCPLWGMIQNANDNPAQNPPAAQPPAAQNPPPPPIGRIVLIYDGEELINFLLQNRSNDEVIERIKSIAGTSALKNRIKYLDNLEKAVERLSPEGYKKVCQAVRNATVHARKFFPSGAPVMQGMEYLDYKLRTAWGENISWKEKWRWEEDFRLVVYFVGGTTAFFVGFFTLIAVVATEEQKKQKEKEEREAAERKALQQALELLSQTLAKQSEHTEKSSELPDNAVTTPF